MLSIVVPSYQRVARLRLSLTTICASLISEVDKGEVIVVDDSGEAKARQVLEEVTGRFPGVRARLVEQVNGGRSAARNRGARESRGDVLLFLDADVLLFRGSLTAHLDAHASGVMTRGSIVHMPRAAIFEDPERGVLTDRARRVLSGAAPTPPVRLEADGSPSEHLLRLGRMTRFERDLHELLAVSQRRWPGATGAHVSIGREDFMRLGGYDERMGRRWGAEDLELGYRAEQAGMTLCHREDAVVLHMDHDVCGREGDHAHALSYFAEKHRDPRVLRLDEYLAGKCSLHEVVS
ncbi:uncharacterized protein SOCEGT47_074490 [Sorangium cellulosum]|uniref:Glycosyltransferase n=1 Tax=Sorangium cellulosum TaxID=56 RepID=A0A4P2QBA7_SORCE|nr:glycosyltransferase family 2 protein [Sorangium cellulosum]AUX26879.1 uncharacterized protein SOCEGT47_074490 [Sorangium cellulosum]